MSPPKEFTEPTADNRPYMAPGQRKPSRRVESREQSLAKLFAFGAKKIEALTLTNRLMYRYLPNPSNGSVESIENRPESAIRPSDGLGCITGGSCMRILLGLGLMLATVLAIAMGAFWHMKRTRKSWSPQSIEQYDHRGSLLPIRSPRPQRQQKDSL